MCIAYQCLFARLKMVYQSEKPTLTVFKVNKVFYAVQKSLSKRSSFNKLSAVHCSKMSAMFLTCSTKSDSEV